MILHKLHWAVFAAGIALLGVAIAGVTQAWSDRGVVVIVVAGLICLLMALVAHRLRDVTIEHGPDGTKVGFKLTPEVVQELKVTGLAGAAATYSFVHNQLAKDPALHQVKVKLQDDVVDMVKTNAFNEPVNAGEVDKVLASGTAAERVLVFGLLQGDRTLVSIDRLRKGILESKSGNEQYQALLAACTHWSTFTPEERATLQGYVRSASYIAEDTDRSELANKILLDADRRG